MAKTYTLQEMGQQLKQANPGKFDTYSDTQLANYYLEAKPQAKSIVLQESTLGGIAKGVGKSATSLVKETSGLGERLLGTLGKAILPKAAERAIGIENAPVLSDMFRQQAPQTGAEGLQETIETKLDITPGSLTEARTGAQTVGKVGGDIAQFLLTPQSKITAAQKALQAVPKVQQAGKLTQFGARIAPQVATDVGIATAQTGDIRQGALAGGFSAALPVVGAGLRGIAKAVPKPQGAMSERIINSLVKPLKKFESYGKNPARGIVREGITFNSLEEGAQKVGERASSLVSTLNNLVSSPKYANKSVDLSSLPQAFEGALEDAVKANNQNLVNRIQQIRNAVLFENKLVDGQIQQVARKNLVVTPQKAVQIKRDIGELIPWTGNASEDTIVNSAIKRAYGITKEKINHAVPESAELNERIADLMSAREAMLYREQIASRRNLLPLGARITGVASFIAGIATVNPVLIALAVADFGIDAALSSPAFKTRLAQFLAKSTPVERKTLEESVPALRPILQRIFVTDKPKTIPSIKRTLDDVAEEMKALPAGGQSSFKEVPDVIELPSSGILEGQAKLRNFNNPTAGKTVAKNQEAFGALGGIEMYTDENGERKIRINPEKAAVGVGLMAGVKSDIGKKAIGKLKGVSDDLIQQARKYKTAEEFANNAPSRVIDELRNQGVRGGEQRMAFWEKATKGMDKTPIIDSLNPTGGLFVDYTPQARMTAKLADNITTLDKTMGKAPDEMITIYRGAPKNQNSIVGGDFVTTNPELARSYTADGNVLSKKVKLSDVLDDINEPLGEEYIYRPKSQLTDIYNQANKTNADDALINEAKKYKSAEEFVKNQPKFYHQSQSKTDFDNFLTKGDVGYKKASYSQAGEGVYFSSNKQAVQDAYGKNGGKLIEVAVQPKKTLDLGEFDAMYFDGRKVNYAEVVTENFRRTMRGEKELPEPDILLTNISKKAKKWLEKEGYDSVYGGNSPMSVSDEFVALDKNIIKTKPQLEQIWKEANKK